MRYNLSPWLINTRGIQMAEGQGRIQVFVRHKTFGNKIVTNGPFDSDAQAKAYVRRQGYEGEFELLYRTRLIVTDGTGKIVKELPAA